MRGWVQRSHLVWVLLVILLLVRKVRRELGSPVFFTQVRPGITGWAQVNGRNTISWESKYKLDVRCVENRTLWLGIKVLWLTVIKVVRDGISAEGEATMAKFTGRESASLGRGQ